MEICEHLQTRSTMGDDMPKPQNGVAMLKGFSFCDVPGSPYEQLKMLDEGGIPPCRGDKNSEHCPFDFE